MNIIEGMDPYLEGTGPCDLRGCIYNTDGRCIYDVAEIRSSFPRACDRNDIYDYD